LADSTQVVIVRMGDQDCFYFNFLRGHEALEVPDEFPIVPAASINHDAFLPLPQNEHIRPTHGEEPLVLSRNVPRRWS